MRAKPVPSIDLDVAGGFPRDAVSGRDRVPRLHGIGAHVKEWLKDQIIESINYAHLEGIDKEEIRNWKWPG